MRLEFEAQSKRKTCYDTRHDDQGSTVAQTLIGNFFAQPHREYRTGSQDDDVGEPENTLRNIGINCFQEEQVAQVTATLYQGNGHRQQTGDRVQFFAPGFPFFGLQTLEVRNGKAQQLNDDRCGNIGHNTQRKNRGLAKGATRESVDQTQE